MYQRRPDRRQHGAKAWQLRPTKLMKFAALSGAGWTLDLIAISCFLRLGVGVFTANFASSCVGLTFVYFTAARFVFRKYPQRFGRFLTTYLAYQCLSILVYSCVLDWLVRSIDSTHVASPGGLSMGVLAKVLITPLSVTTNFLFMKLLTSFMRDLSLQTSVE
jgi:putative flippase GtrA